MSEDSDNKSKVASIGVGVTEAAKEGGASAAAAAAAVEGEGESRVVHIDSPHPFCDASCGYVAVDATTDTRTTTFFLAFDPQSTLDADSDYVTVYKDNSLTEFWGLEKYSNATGGPYFCIHI